MVMESILQAQERSTPSTRTTTTTWRRASSRRSAKANRDDEMLLTGVGGSQNAMKQIEEGVLYRATFPYKPNMAATAVNMARLIALGQGFSELVRPEVPRQLIVPAAVARDPTARGPPRALVSSTSGSHHTRRCRASCRIWPA